MKVKRWLVIGIMLMSVIFFESCKRNSNEQDTFTNTDNISESNQSETADSWMSNPEELLSDVEVLDDESTETIDNSESSENTSVDNYEQGDEVHVESENAEESEEESAVLDESNDSNTLRELADVPSI